MELPSNVSKIRKVRTWGSWLGGLLLITLLSYWFITNSRPSPLREDRILDSQFNESMMLDESHQQYSEKEMKAEHKHKKKNLQKDVDDNTVVNGNDKDNVKPVALVTGITGMIGSYVAKELIKTGKYNVVGIVRYRSELTNLAGVLHDIKLVHGDVNDKGRMHDIVMMEKPLYIYHFAAQAINGASYESAELTLDTNIKGKNHH